MTLRKMEEIIEDGKYQDVINLKDNFLSENKTVFNSDTLLKETSIGMLSTSTLDAMLYSNKFEEFEKHAREIKGFNMLEFKVVGSIYLTKILQLKGQFKEALENSTYVYELQKNSTNIKRSVLNRFYYTSILNLLHLTLLVYENDLKALEILNEFITNLEKDRFTLYDDEKQAIYYYRYIVNLLLDRKEEAKKDLDVAMKINENIELVKKPHDILNPYVNNEGELYANKLYEPKNQVSFQELVLYEKINYYYLLRNNLEYQNYLKLFNANLDNTNKKEFNILNGFLINTLRYNLSNGKSTFY